MGVYAVVVWLPAFLGRSHALTTGQIGTALALIIGVAGGVGTYLGGMLADGLARRDVRWNVWIVAAAYLAPSAAGALGLLLVPGILLGIYIGPTFAMVQGLIDPAMRAVAASLLLFSTDLIGLGVGPQVVGILSDALQAPYGPDALRYALLIVSPLSLWAAYHYQAAGRTLGRDLARTRDRYAPETPAATGPVGMSPRRGIG